MDHMQVSRTVKFRVVPIVEISGVQDAPRRHDDGSSGPHQVGQTGWTAQRVQVSTLLHSRWLLTLRLSDQADRALEASADALPPSRKG